MMAGGGQVGAGLALYLKTKNKKLKQLTRDSITSWYLRYRGTNDVRCNTSFRGNHS